MIRKVSMLLISFILMTPSSWGQKINGVSFVASRNKIDSETIQPVLNVNANWVSVMPFAFMRGLNTPKISYNSNKQWWGERMEGAQETTRLFKEKGVKVMLKPQIWIWDGKFTGFIEMESESDWNIYETQYEGFILDYACLAEEIGAEIFCIGTEMNLFVSERPEFWMQLVMKIKKRYTGKLTYAENWDKITNVPFWSQLDYIGIDAYFPLSDEETPELSELKKGWKKHKNKIKKLQEKVNKQILFTEYGYRSVDYAAEEPWNYDKKLFSKVNHKVQTRSLQALYDEFWNEKWFAGGFLWKWFDYHGRAGGMKHTEFTPQNKPAEVLIRELYRNN